MERYDWEEVGRELRERGGSRLEGLLSPEECRSLVELYPREELFEKTVKMGEDVGGRGVYRFFQKPTPPLVERLRQELYARVVLIANQWNELLGKEERFPPSLSGFLRLCQEAGQQRTTPILLYYEEGGFNELHRDIWGKVFFPFQLAVTLSPKVPRGEEEGFSGGELLLVDEEPGRKAKRTEIETDLGDGVLFCTHSRLVPFAKGFALKAMRHGIKPLLSGQRYALGLPFHDYLGSSL